MARTAITPTALALNSAVDLTAAGVFVAFDQANGMSVPLAEMGQLILHIKNTNAAGRTLTLRGGASGYLGVAWQGGTDYTFAIGANTGNVLVGPFESAKFEQNDGNLYLDIDAGAGVTIAAYHLPI